MLFENKYKLHFINLDYMKLANLTRFKMNKVEIECIWLIINVCSTLYSMYTLGTMHCSNSK